MLTFCYERIVSSLYLLKSVDLSLQLKLLVKMLCRKLQLTPAVKWDLNLDRMFLLANALKIYFFFLFLFHIKLYKTISYRGFLKSGFASKKDYIQSSMVQLNVLHSIYIIVPLQVILKSVDLFPYINTKCFACVCPGQKITII